MTFKSALLLVALAVVLTACGSSQPPPQEQKPPPQRKESVFDPWTGTIERAKGVQQTVDDQAAEQRKRIEAATK